MEILTYTLYQLFILCLKQIYLYGTKFRKCKIKYFILSQFPVEITNVTVFMVSLKDILYKQTLCWYVCEFYILLCTFLFHLIQIGNYLILVLKISMLNMVQHPRFPISLILKKKKRTTEPVATINLFIASGTQL